MKAKIFVFYFLLLFVFSSLSAQVAINSDGSAADAQAMLEVKSSNMGMLVPRINIPATDAEAPFSSPLTTGMLVYNTNAASGTGFHYWDGSEWIKVIKSDDLGGSAKVVMAAEFSGALLVPDGSDNSGYLTSDNAGSAENFMNYYNWVSSQASLQDYDIYLRLEIPANFLSWNADAILVDYQTDAAATSECCVAMTLYKESSATPLAMVSQTASTGWATMSIPAASVAGLSAGETALLQITLYSRNGNAARVGDVSLQYNY